MQREANRPSAENEQAAEVKELLESVARWRRLLRLEDYARLAAGIAIRQSNLAKSSPSPSGSAEFDRSRCVRLLAEARQGLEQGQVDVGWEFLSTFDREFLGSLSPEQRRAMWVSAKAEAAEKLKGWRQLAAKENLEPRADGRPGSSPVDLESEPDLDRLREAFRHLHETYHNKYRKLWRLRRQLRWTGFWVLATLALILVLNYFEFFKYLDAGFEPRVLYLAVVSGLLGGTLSLAFSVVRWNPDRRIPELQAAFAVTLARPLIGAAIAVPVAFLIRSGLLELPGDTDWILVAFCFLGGFSERWFLGIVGRLEVS